MSLIRIARRFGISIAICAEIAALYALFVLGDEKVIILCALFLIIGILAAVAAWIVEELDV